MGCVAMPDNIPDNITYWALPCILKQAFRVNSNNNNMIPSALLLHSFGLCIPALTSGLGQLGPLHALRWRTATVSPQKEGGVLNWKFAIISLQLHTFPNELVDFSSAMEHSPWQWGPLYS